MSGPSHESYFSPGVHGQVMVLFYSSARVPFCLAPPLAQSHESAATLAQDRKPFTKFRPEAARATALHCFDGTARIGRDTFTCRRRIAMREVGSRAALSPFLRPLFHPHEGATGQEDYDDHGGTDRSSSGQDVLPRHKARRAPGCGNASLSVQAPAPDAYGGARSRKSGPRCYKLLGGDELMRVSRRLPYLAVEHLGRCLLATAALHALSIFESCSRGFHPVGGGRHVLCHFIPRRSQSERSSACVRRASW